MTGRRSWSGCWGPCRSGLEVFAHLYSVPGKLDTLGLGIALIGIHRVVILRQQPFDPTPVQIHRATAQLLVQRFTHDRRQPLESLTAQALVDIGQALQHALGEQPPPQLFAVQRDEFGAQVDHVVAQDTFDTVLEAVLQPHQRVLLHALVQRQRHRATADDTAFIFEHELLDAACALFQHIDGQLVFEVDLRRLRRGAFAEAGTAVVGVAFKVEHVAQLLQHIGLAGAGKATQQDEIAVLHGVLGGI